MTAGRRGGTTLSPSARARYGVHIRALWTADRELTAKEIERRTGAPLNLVRDVRERLVAQGVLRAGHMRAWP